MKKIQTIYIYDAKQNNYVLGCEHYRRSDVIQWSLTDNILENCYRDLSNAAEVDSLLCLSTYHLFNTKTSFTDLFVMTVAVSL